MASKGPKKKESKDQVSAGGKEINQGLNSQLNDDKSSARKKSAIPLWGEWTDQDIANEKWDLAKREKDRGRSPNAASHYFDDPEGLIDLPLSLKPKVQTWKRPTDILPEDVVPVIVDHTRINDTQLDILTPNEHIACSEVMCSIISTITSLYQFFTPTNAEKPSSSYSKYKPNPQNKEHPAKDSKAERNRKENDVIEELPWKPWDLIWPKDSLKPSSMPIISSSGKYAVKLYWMGCYRKIIIDDTIPCDSEMRPLLPLTSTGFELWPLLLTKALLKVASLDYFGGRECSEMGEVNFVHCLIGWLPEQIPLDSVYRDRIWQLLLKVLPNWKLPLPPFSSPQCVNRSNFDMKTLQSHTEVLTSSKQELNVKDSKDKNKKEDIPSKKEETPAAKKIKHSDKTDTKGGAKDKSGTPNLPYKQGNIPEYLLFASFNGSAIRNQNRTFSDLKRDSGASGKLRQYGLLRYLPHPVHLSVARNRPLIPPPSPVHIPRWKLIRQKKKVKTSEPSLHPKEQKEPKFLELKTPFLNFKVSPTPAPSSSRLSSRSRRPMDCLGEEIIDDNGNIAASKHHEEDEEPATASELPTDQQIDSSCVDLNDDGGDRKLSFDSQKSISVLPSKSPRHSKSRSSSREARKSILKERKSIETLISNPVPPTVDQQPKSDPPKPPQTPPTEITSSEDSNEGTNDDQDPALDNGDAKTSVDIEQQELWMDLDDFFESFNTLWIYHKPKQFCKNIIDLKKFDIKNDRNKKSSGHNLGVPGGGGRSTILTPISFLYSGNATSDAPPPYFMVDCLKDVEILITLQSFSRWFDHNSNIDYVTDDGKIDKEMLKQIGKPVPGSLVVEPYSWKRIASSAPMLKIRTTGVKSVFLSLPPGRHVLRLMITAPLGYNVHLSSRHPFHFGDENFIMQELKSESQRFTEHSIDVVKQITNIVRSFTSSVTSPKTTLVLGTENKPNRTRLEHYEALFKSFSTVVKKEMGANCQPSTAFSLEVLKYQAYFHLIKFDKKPKRRPSSMPNRLSGLRHLGLQRSSLPAIHFNIDTPEEKAAIKIQAAFKGFFAKKLRRACFPGSPENTSSIEQLSKVLQLVDANTEQVAMATYRHMFTEKPGLFLLFPFHADDWNKISYIDYTGSYPEQPGDSWFVICRDIFHVQESFLILPKFYCNVSGCHLLVINNDTFQEVQTVFRRVIPQVLKKNKSGYTFIVTAYIENAIPAGKFKLRVIGERDPLPAPTKEKSINSSFHCYESRDYYVPDKYNRIFRHTIETTEDVLASIQFTASKDDTYIKLQVLDQEKVIHESNGKKYVTMPSFIFFKDYVANAEKNKSAPNSRTGSGRSSSKQSSTANKRPSSSRKSVSPEKTKSKIIEHKIPEIIEETKLHKYVIQGFVEQDSWPLTRKQWDFVENLNNVEEEERHVEVKAEHTGKSSAGKTRGGKNNAKDAKGVRSRPESQNQNPFDVSQPHWTLKVVVDSIMESCVEIRRDTEREDEIKSVKNAWETHEPGRAAKAQQTRGKYLVSRTATESSEPLMELLSSDEDDEMKDDGVVGDGGEEKEDDNENVGEVNTKGEEIKNKDSKQDAKKETIAPVLDVFPSNNHLSATSSPSLLEIESGVLYISRPPKESDPVIKQFDVTPFIRSTGKPVLLDSTKEEEVRSKLEERFQKYYEFREMVLSLREEDRVARNVAKEKQIQQYEEMQVQLDTAREVIFKAREEYRSKFFPKANDTEGTDLDLEKKKRTPSPKRKPSKINRTHSRGKKK